MVLRDATLTLSDNSKVDISNISAGTQLALHSLTFADLPNKIPMACAVDVHLGNIQLLKPKGEIDDFVKVDSSTLYGHTTCPDSLHLMDEDMTTVHSACNDLDDGIHYILPYGLYHEEHYPLLPVWCDRGSTILDVSLAFDRYQQYFSSLYLYDKGISGPSLDDFASWREWWLPFENRDIKAVFEYGVSDDCARCEYGNDATDAPDVLSTNNAYYMTVCIFMYFLVVCPFAESLDFLFCA